MYYSHFRKVPAVLGILDKLSDVRSVLDVGAGYGKYGVLLREHLDIRKGRLDRANWRAKIDAVEPNLPILCRNPYDKIYPNDIKDIFQSLGEYDLILIADVLEYMDKKSGLSVLLSLFKEHCRQGIVVSFSPARVRALYKEQQLPICTYEPHDFHELFIKTEFKGQQVVYIYK